jgi:signal transduction histidine kinase
MPAPGSTTDSAAARGRAALPLGILLLRWATLAWTTVVAVATTGDLRHPAVAWAAIALALLWTAWLTLARPGPRGQGTGPAPWYVPVREGPDGPGPGRMVVDLAVGVALVAATGAANQPGALSGAAGLGSVFSTAYPIAAAVSWGAARGVGGGLVAGAVLGVALVVARVVNGESLDDLRTVQALGLAGGAVNFLLAGAAVGLLARLLDQAAIELGRAVDASVRASARAARLAERESLARQIHDSVLQSLAMVNKRGRELAAGGRVPGGEVARLAELAGEQERALRALLLREPAAAPSGRASLREALEALARSTTAGPTPTVSAVGPLWLPTGCVNELVAAVRQALENVAEHAQADTVAVFAEQDDDHVLVSVRDDGVGFDFDPEALRAEGKLGLLQSMRGRVEHLGGTMLVDSAPGRGTEIEFRVPANGVPDDEEER